MPLTWALNLLATSTRSTTGSRRSEPRFFVAAVDGDGDASAPHTLLPLVLLLPFVGRCGDGSGEPGCDCPPPSTGKAWSSLLTAGSGLCRPSQSAAPTQPLRNTPVNPMGIAPHHRWLPAQQTLPPLVPPPPLRVGRLGGCAPRAETAERRLRQAKGRLLAPASGTGRQGLGFANTRLQRNWGRTHELCTVIVKQQATATRSGTQGALGPAAGSSAARLFTPTSASGNRAWLKIRLLRLRRRKSSTVLSAGRSPAPLDSSRVCSHRS